jgi:signal transduction histidine kinase
LRALLQEEFAGALESVAWQCEPAAEHAAAGLPALAADLLFYAAREAVRNAARHGRRAADAPLNLRLNLEYTAGLRLVVEDDGVGWAGPGPAGHGLALHGALNVASAPGRFTRVSLELPVSPRQR